MFYKKKNLTPKIFFRLDHAKTASKKPRISGVSRVISLFEISKSWQVCQWNVSSRLIFAFLWFVPLAILEEFSFRENICLANIAKLNRFTVIWGILKMLLLLCWCFKALQYCSGHFGHCQLTHPHCSWANLQANLPVLSAYSFASNWQLLFLNQWKGKNGCRNYFISIKEDWTRDRPYTMRTRIQLSYTLKGIKRMRYFKKKILDQYLWSGNGGQNYRVAHTRCTYQWCFHYSKKTGSPSHNFSVVKNFSKM